MKILAIDTSCEQASCALYIDGNITEKKSPEDKRKHSSVLMPMIMDFLNESRLTVSDINLFAIGSGPGSFTGIRIGMAAVKGMSLVTGRDIMSAKSLDILANKYGKSDDLICPMIDARNRQVYTAIYKWDVNCYKPITDYMGIKVDELAKILATQKKPVMLCGDAHEKYLEYFVEELNHKKIKADSLNKYPSAAVLAKMTADKSSLVKRGSATDTMPFYLRESQAERLHDKK